MTLTTQDIHRMFSTVLPLCTLAWFSPACAPELMTAEEADSATGESGEDTDGNEEAAGEAVDSEANDDDDEAGEEGSDLPGGDQITHEIDGDGWLTTVDATDHETWIWLDVDSGAQAPESGGETWDLGFRRFEIQLNGGVNGNAGVAAAWLEGQNLDDVTEVPQAGDFVEDKEDNNDDGKPELAFAEWYDYDLETHVLTPKEGSYVIVSGDGSHYVLQVVDYYSETGTSGHMQYRWKKLDGDEG